MKRMGLIIAAILTGTIGFAQNINYKVIQDNPEDVSNLYINFDILQFEMPLNNITGMSFCVGANAYASYKNKFGAEIGFRRGWLNLHGVPRTNFELGGFFNFSSRIKTRSQRVILDVDKYTSGNMEYTNTKFIKCPAQNLRLIGARAGFLTNKELYKDERDVLSGTYTYRWTGLYAGIQLTSQMNYRINTDLFGEAGAGFVRRFYADVTFHPFASLTDQESGTKSNTSIGRLGFRLGVVAMPAERRKIQAPIYIRIEGGMRPLDGIYMMGSFGINIKRKLPKLGIQETRRETE